MTDELMDARLRAAGERWRTADRPGAPVEAPLAVRPAPVVRHRARWVAAVSAAVIAAALVVSGVVLLTNRDTNGTPVAAQPSTPHSSAPHGPAPQPSVPLVGTRWTLTQLIDPNGTHAPDGNPFLQFVSRSAFVGTDGCNSLGGKAAISARTITVSDVMATLMACPGSTATQVSGMLMSGTLDYRIVGSSLILTRAGDPTLIYRAASAVTKQDPSQLVGRWRLQSTEITTHSGSNTSAEAHSAVAQSVLTFDGRGGFTVQHRCYVNQGKAAVSAGTAELTRVTLKSAVPCPSGSNPRAEEQENGFVDDLLSGRVSWHIDAGGLTISRNGHSATFSR
jgi:heat shock protein HslJ